MKLPHKIILTATIFLQTSLYSLPLRPSILFIGDSNTEKGFLTGALQQFFDTTYGYTGSGYCPFNTTDLTVPYIGFKPFTSSITYGSTFTPCDMYNGVRAFTPPYPSPDGMWLHGSTVGDSIIVRSVVGGGIDLYWLSKPSGGTFKAFIDGVQKVQVTTSGAISQTNKTTIAGLDSNATRPHKLKISIVSGDVTLLGFDMFPDSSGNSKRAVVHNWGNSWASTVDFIKIDTTVFRTALQTLNPDVVVILLGENDVGNDHLDSLTFKNNLTTISHRVRNALPNVNILLVSSHCYVSHFISWSYPQAAAETSAKFWDMYTFFQPYANTYTQDGGGHINPAGGVLCATQLWKELNKDFPTSVKLKNPIQENNVQSASTKYKTGYYLLNGRKLTSTDFNEAKRETLLPAFVIVK